MSKPRGYIAHSWTGETGGVVVTSERFAAVRRGLPDYQLHEVIGDGAFGVVVSATQVQMDRQVAVKVLRSDHAHQAEVRRRFGIEANVLARFHHPHIVDVYDYRESDDFCALIMERLEGGSLGQRLGRWPLRPKTACAVAITVCSALDYAHAHDVLHRDIKPANLLFGQYGGVEALKLTDFGIAKVVSAVDQPTRVGTFLGTASYMAPEQIEGRDPGPGVDVYGTATLLYQMLSDRLPFSSEGSDFAVAQRHLNSAPIPLSTAAPHLPTALTSVVMCGLARDAADRQHSAQELGVAIARVARTSFGPDWLDDEIRPLAPGAILEAASGRTRAPRDTPSEPPTRTHHRSPPEVPPVPPLPHVPQVPHVHGRHDPEVAPAHGWELEPERRASTSPAPAPASRPSMVLLGVLVGALLVAMGTVAAVLLLRSNDGSGTASVTPASAVPASGPFTSAAARPRRSVTTSPPSSGPGDVRTLPAGLFCRDLMARGYSYTAAIDYWHLHGQPNQMDADRNGIPCETVYPPADVSSYWSVRDLPPAVTVPLALPSGLFCRDLYARGVSYADAVSYWWNEGAPDRMDADLNGIPCETVYPSDVVDSFW